MCETAVAPEVAVMNAEPKANDFEIQNHRACRIHAPRPSAATACETSDAVSKRFLPKGEEDKLGGGVLHRNPRIKTLTGRDLNV
jgi:hypothetical protein